MAYKTTKRKQKSGTIFTKTQHTGGKGTTRSVSVSLGSSTRACVTRSANGSVKRTTTHKGADGFTKRTTKTLTKAYKSPKPKKPKPYKPPRRKK